MLYFESVSSIKYLSFVNIIDYNDYSIERCDNLKRQMGRPDIDVILSSIIN